MLSYYRELVVTYKCQEYTHDLFNSSVWSTEYSSDVHNLSYFNDIKNNFNTLGKDVK
jgi:hypothetical protein